VGVAGFGWLVLWFAFIRAGDLPAPEPDKKEDTAGLWRIFASRRIWIVFFAIATINTTWQILRAWLPKILQESRGFSEPEARYFVSLWFVATEVGCLGAGAL